MTRRARLPDSDLADLGNAYGHLSPQRQWDAISEEPVSWWPSIVQALIILALGGAAGTLLYFLVLGWS